MRNNVLKQETKWLPALKEQDAKLFMEEKVNSMQYSSWQDKIW